MNTNAERFWAKVASGPATQCWEWQGCLTSAGFGRVHTNGKVELAHKIAYCLTTGVEPTAALRVIHRCGNNACVNPHHLLRTEDNQKVRRRRGASHPMAILTEEDVGLIRSLHGRKTMSELASKWKVSRATISYIINRKRWKHF